MYAWSSVRVRVSYYDNLLATIYYLLPTTHLVQRPTGLHRWAATVHLQRTNRGDDDGGVRREAGVAALDVEELFCFRHRLRFGG